jgi:hypothetical protein
VKLLAAYEYIILLHNLIWERRISYELPAEVHIEKIKEGVEKCLFALRESDEPPMYGVQFIRIIWRY